PIATSSWRAPGACRSKTEAEASYRKRWSASVISGWSGRKRLEYGLLPRRVGEKPMAPLTLLVGQKFRKRAREKFKGAGQTRVERLSKNHSNAAQPSGTVDAPGEKGNLTYKQTMTKG